VETTASASLTRRGLAFLAGVGFAAVPTVGPYLAILAVATGRLEIQRADRWWWAAALLLGVPWLLTGHVWLGFGAVVQVVAVWLIFRSASEFRRALRDTSLPHDVGAGMLVGFVGAMALGLDRSATWRLETARSAIDLLAWSENPALFGHAMLVLAALLAVVLPSPALRVAALLLGALAALVSGAQEVVLAWLLIAAGLRYAGRRGGRATALAEWALIVLMVAVASGLTGTFGLGRTGYRLDLVPPAAGANLFRGTEIPGGEWWYPLGVRVAAEPVVIDGVERTGYRVTKLAPEAWSRLQQIVELRPEGSYVLAVAWRAEAGVQPGLDGWGRADDGGAVNLAALARDGAWFVTATEPIRVLGSGIAAGPDGWVRGHVAFRYDGGRPLVWYVGAVPDRSGAVGATTTFAEFQLIEADALLPYVPNATDVRLADLRTTRLPLWQEAVEAIGARPWLGWGPGGFPAASWALRPDEARFKPLAAHAHNLLLDTWVERGIVGLIGLLLLAGVLSLRVLQQRDRAMAVVLAGIVVLNLFETTLLNGALVYPLAAVLGWRAVGHRAPALTQTGYGSAAAVRLALAATDVAVAAAAISVGLVIGAGTAPVAALMAGWTPGLAYATLLWPAFAWLSGLYPGYGRAAHEELARGVRASAAATVTLGFSALVLAAAVPVGTVTVLVAGVLSVTLAPLARVGTKQLLRHARLWGRPIVVIGTSPAAARVTRYLLDHPGVGLHPVAAFGDTDWDLPDLPVTGRIDHVWTYLQHHHVVHAVVGSQTAAHVGYDEVLRRAERVLRYVQFVPDLHGVPASSVVAAPLGTTLGLEVRNQLASGTNRAVKRTVDAAGSALALVLLGPLLLLFAAWVRLDSRGPALYLSPRVGRYGRTFACVKFRTMHVDAEARLERLLATDPRLRDEYERFHKLDDDPRVTRAGRWLRRASLDELPQLVNVFLGQMSLVGPRPYLVRELEQMGPDADLIFLARPGITGYWQVEGRNDVTFEERQAMEAAYVRNWSVWWDVEILVRTPLVVLTRTGK
jgi:Undecaprenyl-phosphate galactose phosphotransferase WbaP